MRRRSIFLSCCSAFLFSVTSPLHAAPLPGAHVVIGAATVDWRQQLARRSETLRWTWRSAHTDAVPAGTPPAITHGLILTPQLDVSLAPAAPAVRVTFTAAAPGLAEIDAVYLSPSGQQSLVSMAQYGLYGRVSGRFTVQQILGRSTNTFGSFGHYAEPGTWYLTHLAIMDTSGQVTDYTGPTLAPIVKDVRVELTNTDAPDITAPEFTAGKVLTTSVSRSAPSPVAEISVQGFDDVSGIEQGSVELSDGNGDSLHAFSIAGAPIVSGHFLLYAILNAATPTGTYKISSFSGSDVPGNLFSDSSPADIAAVFGAADAVEVTQ